MLPLKQQLNFFMYLKSCIKFKNHIQKNKLYYRKFTLLVISLSIDNISHR